MKYDKCDFSLYGYYIHDVIFGDSELILICFYKGKEERMVCFTGVTDLEGIELMNGRTIKYLAVANKKDGSGVCYKILYMEHCQYSAFCARSFTNKKRS